MTTTAPYGTWTSPISAAALAESAHPVQGGIWVGDDVWWLEQRPAEGGRLAVRRAGDDGGDRGSSRAEPVDVLPAPWNARTRVHEYGGGSWAVTDDGDLVFAEFTDQRLYVLRGGETEPEPLTPQAGGFRFAELRVRGHEVIAVREIHSDAGLDRDIVAVPLDGSARDDPAALRSVVGGSHFVAFPRFSPDGSKLAWIAWEHPQMPWDGTELRVGDVGPDGS
ncbi:hypothetical protein GCM10025867_03950 [Frondihabitans sucicola]|uniref:S9 family peptidase n=1 Tax=Frondihabitans sucicola TaxID=1268041 RepID=A0ABM8GII4_9MICO|nr:hypothetical protein [Frondihabitans sucicola]BDZ48154.1 hypothetical protein GCM10025867_03950 [Frondihabitans sucicola]